MVDQVPATEAIYVAMSQVLDSIVSVYEQEDIDLPDRRYLAINDVAYDSEQLTVAFQQMYAGLPGSQLETPVRCNDPRSMVLQIQLVRCTPVPSTRGAAPAVEKYDEVTKMMTRDAFLLMDGALASPPALAFGAIADAATSDDNGGLQAIQLNFTCGIP